MNDEAKRATSARSGLDPEGLWTHVRNWAIHVVVGWESALYRLREVAPFRFPKGTALPRDGKAKQLLAGRRHYFLDIKRDVGTWTNPVTRAVMAELLPLLDGFLPCCLFRMLDLLFIDGVANRLDRRAAAKGVADREGYLAAISVQCERLLDAIADDWKAALAKGWKDCSRDGCGVVPQLAAIHKTDGSRDEAESVPTADERERQLNDMITAIMGCRSRK